ncbi:MAG: hypothetical protein OEY28_12005, partial [Nitrospira sp.]|nr:hypothetical protein [Nitrospira sp.]
MKPVAITGIGVIGATGAGVAAMDDAISVGRSGLGSLSLWQSELAESCPVGEFKGDLREATEAALSRKLNTREIKRLSRSDLLTLAAAAEAVAGSGLSRDLLSAAGAGAYLGQSVCGTFDSETFYIETRAGRGPRNPAPLVVHEGAGSIDALAREFNLCGPSAAYMTACSSAANAIGMAAEVLNEGSAKVMLAGGGDSLSRIAFNGFCSLQVVSPDGPRPFDRDRQGMSVGEGAAILVLETIEHAKARGAEVLALLSGYGHSCDAYHLTAPHPEGEGASRAMGEALATAGISKGDVGYINAHGTATL